MRCEVAREALSARLDGEHEGVPSARVDEHLEECSECCAWYIHADRQAASMRGLNRAPAPDLTAAVLARANIVPPSKPRRFAASIRAYWINLCLTLCGCAQVGVAMSQMTGYQYGMTGHDHPMFGSTHLMNETTAWALALGVAMIIAGWWRPAIPGLLIVLCVFTVMLVGYVVHDALQAGVTVSRVVSHLPVVVGLICTITAARQPSRPLPPQSSDRTPHQFDSNDARQDSAA